MTASVNVVNTPIRVTVSASGTAVTVASTGPAAPGGSGTVTGVSATSPIVSGGTAAAPIISHATTLAGESTVSFITAMSVNTFGHITALTGVDASTMRGAMGLKAAAVLDVGTAAGTVSAGDDSRLSDARTPVAHSADLVTSGTLGVDRIPTITLAKVSDSGTAAAADTGTGSTNVILGNDSRLTDARTPVAHSTDLLTSGTLAVARGGTGSATAPMMGVVTAADAAAARSVLGLGTASTSASTAFVASSAVSTYGASLVDDADASAARTTLGLGTAATTDATAYAAAVHVQSAATITSGTLAVARGGTGVTSLPMIGVASAADAAAARTVLGVSNVGAYTGQIETVADKTYTLDAGAATARTITGLYIKSASGTVTAALKVGTAVVKSASVTDSTGDQSSLANTSVSANDVVSIATSSNDAALDVVFAVEYTE